MSFVDPVYLEHLWKNLSLLILSSIFVPFSSAPVLSVLTINRLLESAVLQTRRAIREDAAFKPRVILVTGVGMAKGLALARSFFEAGHTVIGADFRHNGVAGSGSVSRALTRFYHLDAPDPTSGAEPYIEALLTIILEEHVELWVSCSGVASAVEDGEAKETIEARTSCRAVQFDAATTQTLHEKDSFIQHVRSLSLTVPETHTVESHAQALSALRQAPDGREFIMKPIGMDDANRGDMSLLPKPTPDETEAHLSALRISRKAPWILQQFIRGPEYCTHALVIRGRVRVFVACPSAELLMHYEALPSGSPLNRAMLRFTEKVAEHGGEGFTGHLSFDFIVDEDGEGDGDEPVIYPIECNPRAHTAVVLFAGTEGVAEAYLSLLETGTGTGTGRGGEGRIVTPDRRTKYYWVGHDLGELGGRVIMALRGRERCGELVGELIAFAGHLLFWRDGTFAWWDPAPWWWLYHAYWPMQFLGSLRSGKRWSRINVSTNKVFAC